MYKRVFEYWLKRSENILYYQEVSNSESISEQLKNKLITRKILNNKQICYL